MASQVIIELGTDWGPPDAESGAGVPRSGYLRWWGLLGAMLAVLLGTSAAAVAPGPRVVELATIADAGVNAVLNVDGQTALIINDSRVTAYDAATGKRRWVVTLPGTMMTQPMWFGDRIVFAFEPTPPAGGGSANSRIAVVDRATGGWQTVDRVGYPTRLGPSTVLLQGEFETSSGVLARSELTVFDVERMAVVHTMPAPISWTTSQDGGALYTLSTDATLSEWDIAGWTLRRSVALPVRLLDWATVWASERTLSVRTGLTMTDDGPQFERPESTVLSVDLATLEPVTEAAPWHLNDCGPVWCALSPDDVEYVLVLDKSTGKQLWRIEAHRTMLTSSAGMLLVDMMSTETGPLVVGIVDPFTGRVLTGLNGWTLVTSRYLESRREEPTYMVRPNRVPGSAFLGVVTADDGVDLIGELNFIVRHCDFAGRYLACADGRGAVRLLRVDR